VERLPEVVLRCRSARLARCGVLAAAVVAVSSGLEVRGTHACRFRALNVQAGTQFCDGEFQAEVNSGRLSSGSLDNFSCIALAGVATEYLRSVRASCCGNNWVIGFVCTSRAPL
jgi:hypothetical protein